jgi:hypothetical protein
MKGLTFMPLDINSLSLLVFTDASFTNNKDLLSQIGFVIVLTDRKSDLQTIIVTYRQVGEPLRT